ncbi:hypothetical protein WJX72_009211 [[Myrmecia] bisecta]|uniref:Uncharacterized protein n=1 Tax=[Myrmecia] bisecta TaxID=41462 RepID=A0AAW1P2L5_9CHLO
MADSVSSSDAEDDGPAQPGQLEDALQQAEQWLGIQASVSPDLPPLPRHVDKKSPYGSLARHGSSIQFLGIPAQRDVMPLDRRPQLAAPRRSRSQDTADTGPDFSRAGVQDEVVWLRSTLNEKETELLELREQHIRLIHRSQEARQNWEAALASKDRAIAQLEEALAAQKHALEQQRPAGVAAAAVPQPAPATDAAAQQELAQVRQQKLALERQKQVLEAALNEAREKLAAQANALADATARAENDSWRAQENMREVRAAVAERSGELVQLERQNQVLKDQLAEANARAAANTELQKENLDRHNLRKSAPAAGWGAPQWDADPAQSKAEAIHLRELHLRLARVQEKLQSRDASARKYKDAVRALKAHLQQAKAAMEASQAEILRLKARLARWDASPDKRRPKRDDKHSRRSSRSASDDEDDRGEQQHRHSSRSRDDGRAQADLERLREDMARAERERKAAVEEVDALSRKLAVAEKRCEDADRRAESAERKTADVQHRCDNMARRAERAEHSVEKAEQRASDAADALKKAEQKSKQAESSAAEAGKAAEEAQARVEAAERRLSAVEARAKRAEASLKERAQASTTTEKHLAELERRCTDAEQRADDATERLRVAEARSLDSAAAEQDMQRRLRTCQAQQQEAQAELRAAKADVPEEVSAARSKWESRHREELAELQDMRLAVSKARIAKERAEARALELEAALQHQSAASASLRQAAGSEGGHRAAAEARLSSLQATLSSREHAISDLEARLKRQEALHKQAEDSLRVQLAKRIAALADANRRFADLEAVMRRIAARSAVT